MGALLQKKFINSLTKNDDKSLGMEDIDKDDDSGDEKLIMKNFLNTFLHYELNNTSNHESVLKEAVVKNTDANAVDDGDILVVKSVSKNDIKQRKNSLVFPITFIETIYDLIAMNDFVQNTMNTNMN